MKGGGVREGVKAGGRRVARGVEAGAGGGVDSYCRKTLSYGSAAGRS